MIQGELNGEPVTFPELRLFHRESERGRQAPAIAVEDPFGKTWASSQQEVTAGGLFEIDIPTGDDKESYITIRMRAIRPADRSEMIAALKKCPHKVLLAKGFWYEVIAD